jgi:hypothetical protein
VHENAETAEKRHLDSYSRACSFLRILCGENYSRACSFLRILCGENYSRACSASAIRVPCLQRLRELRDAGARRNGLDVVQAPVLGRELGGTQPAAARPGAPEAGVERRVCAQVGK